jgi:hypothetical protein
VTEDGKTNLDEMTVAELRERASALEITGRSSMNKDELLQSVRDAEEQTAMMEARESTSGDAAGNSASDTSAEDWSPPTDTRSDSAEDGGDDGDDTEDITAPSIGPNTTIEHVPPDERLDMDKISDVDAMGLDKRRQVGGQRYGASPAKQLAVYGGALAVITALVIGGIILTNELDKAPPEGEVEPAPWSNAEQKAPAPIDFPRSTEQ